MTTPRPPGAVESTLFGKLCTGCGKCAEVCPTEAIQIRENLAEFVGPCVRCMECTKVCPTDAILDIPEKSIKIGTAHLNPEHCRAWNPTVGDCLVCWEFCPVGAIKLSAPAVRENPNRDPREFVSKPVVDQKSCIGCATCVHACPEKPSVISLRRN